MASFPNIAAILSCVFLLIMSSMSRRAYATNILLTGQTLGPNEKLSYDKNCISLAMHFNCTLELQDGFGSHIWYSPTICCRAVDCCRGCRLSLTDRGQLVVHDLRGDLKWRTPYIRNSRVGKYVGVLHPDGEFAIYGPGIWSVSPELESVNFNKSEKASSKNNLKNGPTVYNVLFPNQVLYDGDKLSDNGYEFIFKDCQLILKQNGETRWNSNTNLYGDNCFAKVEYNGELTIRNGDHKKIWSNNASGEVGKYVLVMQENGSVVIYGPEVWASRDLTSGFIEMATIEK